MRVKLGVTLIPRAPRFPEFLPQTRHKPRRVKKENSGFLRVTADQLFVAKTTIQERADGDIQDEGRLGPDHLKYSAKPKRAIEAAIDLEAAE